MCSISVITSLYNSQAYLEGYFGAVGQIENKNETEVLLIHNVPNEEEMNIINKFLPQLPFVKHIVVPQREGLYASWNRGIILAKGEFVAIWNVDDIRTPDSLTLQKNALLTGKAAMCYGDFYGTSNYGPYKERLYEYKDYSHFRKEALSIHIIGCFPMWRKEIHKDVGYFDEQFRLVSDYEFQIRVAMKYDLVKSASVLGYYLEYQGHKLSSNKKLQDRERTVVELRYKLFNRVLLHVLPSISDFRIKEFMNFGKWVSLNKVVPASQMVNMKSILSFIAAPFSYSFWVIKRTSNAVYHFFFQ